MTEAAAAALAAWLQRLDRRDPTRIEPGLERIGVVLDRLRLRPPPFRVLSVGGTNGKGSVVAYLSNLLVRAGAGPVGAYTSPHLGTYGERMAVDGRPLGAAPLVAAFEAVQESAQGISLTYFEFATAAALQAFRTAAVRVAVLEVGLGGRLDAVNALDAEAAAVVSVGLDHQEWLGTSRDAIGREKAGIFRRGRPAIVGDRDPPSGLLESTRTVGAELRCIGRDFDAVAAADGWHFRAAGVDIGPLPEPGIRGPRQRDNAAVALALLQCFLPALPPVQVLAPALASSRLAGRIDRRAGEVEWLLDVAHNPDAAAALGEWLEQAPRRRTLAVFAMLGDKDAAGVAAAVAGRIDRWYLAGLGGRRGQSAGTLAERVAAAVRDPVLCDNIREAVGAAAQAAGPGDRILVFGSFHTVGEALATGRIPAEGG